MNRAQRPGATGPGQVDNLDRTSRRLSGVAEGEAWEHELRQMLASQASQLPPPRSELVTEVVGRARRSARRRNLARLATVVGATVLATGVLMQDWQPPGEPYFGAVTGRVGEPVAEQVEESVRMSADHRLAVELSVQLLAEGADGGTVLATAQGELIALRQIRQVRSAHQVGDGWAVVSGQPGTLQLWWASHDQRPVSLLTGLDAVVVDGDRVAWQRLGVLAAARLVGGQLTGRVTTTGTADGELPVGMLGRSVLLRRFDLATGTWWDTWDPDLGAYRPSWTQTAQRVYGMLPDGDGALGLVSGPTGGDDPTCLASLDVRRRFEVGRTRCLSLSLEPAAPAVISPDRRLLLATTDTGQLALVQLEQLFDLAVDPVLPLPDAPAPDTPPVWLGSDRVLWTASDQLVVLWPHRLVAGLPTALETVPLTGSAPVAVGFS